MPVQPANPEPLHTHNDGMLARKFGREVANYFAGNPLNRVAFLRGDHTFLSQALHHPSTNFLPCRELQPLVETGKPAGEGRIAWVQYEDVKSIVGEDPFATTEKDQVEAFDSEVYVPQMVFLGIDEAGGKGGKGLSYTTRKNTYTGVPHFAVDVTPRHGVKEACEKLLQEQEGKGREIAKGRVMDVVATDAATYAEARQLLDWNARNPFCAGCGQPTLSVNGGFKRTCPPKDIARRRKDSGDSDERPFCATRQGVSNLSFPRTDPTVIMAVVNAKGDRILLGRQKRWPPYWFSTLAGFAEPAESIEEAVRREVYEEAGILVGRVVIHSTQPWPYPANLMIGAIGQAIPEGETIDLGNDPELDDARWFEFDEVREALRVGTSGLGEDAGSEYKEGGLRLPPSTAIANQLMTSVCEGFHLVGPKM